MERPRFGIAALLTLAFALGSNETTPQKMTASFSAEPNSPLFDVIGLKRNASSVIYRCATQADVLESDIRGMLKDKDYVPKTPNLGYVLENTELGGTVVMHLPGNVFLIAYERNGKVVTWHQEVAFLGDTGVHPHKFCGQTVLVDTGYSFTHDQNDVGYELVTRMWTGCDLATGKTLWRAPFAELGSFIFDWNGSVYFYRNLSWFTSVNGSSGAIGCLQKVDCKSGKITGLWALSSNDAEQCFGMSSDGAPAIEERELHVSVLCIYGRQGADSASKHLLSATLSINTETGAAFLTTLGRERKLVRIDGERSQ